MIAIITAMDVELENKKNAEYIDSYGDVSVTALESDRDALAEAQEKRAAATAVNVEDI